MYVPHQCNGRKFAWNLIALGLTVIDLSIVSTRIELLDRWDISIDWLTLPDGLNIPRNSIHTFNDTVRYTNVIYEEDPTDRQRSGPLRQPHRRRRPQWSRPGVQAAHIFWVPVLFWVVRGVTQDFQNLAQIADASMVFRNPLLSWISRMRLFWLLGGPSGYIGLHLRVGDGPFLVSLFSIFSILSRVGLDVLRDPLDSAMRVNPCPKSFASYVWMSSN